MTTCKHCGAPAMGIGEPGYRGRICRECVRKREAARYLANREAVLARNARWRAAHAQPDSPYRERQKIVQGQRKAQIRAEVLAHYGNRCACCGEREPLFLTIDHTNGYGRRHRESIKRYDMAYWVWKQGYPPGFQLLCLNCNMGKWRNGGTCPHEAEGLAQSHYRAGGSTA